MCICKTESHTQKGILLFEFSNVYLFASLSKCSMNI